VFYFTLTANICRYSQISYSNHRFIGRLSKAYPRHTFVMGIDVILTFAETDPWNAFAQSHPRHTFVATHAGSGRLRRTLHSDLVWTCETKYSPAHLHRTRLPMRRQRRQQQLCFCALDFGGSVIRLIHWLTPPVCSTGNAALFPSVQICLTQRVAVWSECSSVVLTAFEDGFYSTREDIGSCPKSWLLLLLMSLGSYYVGLQVHKCERWRISFWPRRFRLISKKGNERMSRQRFVSVFYTRYTRAFA
jgi:hypothetical protein